MVVLKQNVNISDKLFQKEKTIIQKLLEKVLEKNNYNNFGFILKS